MDKKADYLLSLKGNQGTLHQSVKLFFELTNNCPPVGHTRYDGGHGWIEAHRVRATSDIRWLTEDHAHWSNITSIIAVVTIRECKDSTTKETRYFISSLDATNPERLGQIVRAH
jgi:predicted transposase YbfD/YdcC